MKKAVLIITSLMLTMSSFSQKIDANYVKNLYSKYPTTKSSLCPACKEWVNPFYKSIADTQKHMPIVEYEYFTKENYAKVSTLKVPRTGIYAAWHPVLGQPNEDNVYTAANKVVKEKGGEIAKGHVECWILNAFSYDAAILSDTYTFNAALEEQRQNVGTEIATENLTRKLLETQDVEVWGGTYGSQGTFTDGKITDTYPSHYWKIIKYGTIIRCWWMPNLPTETQTILPQREITEQQLIVNLGFDPRKIFPGK